MAWDQRPCGRRYYTRSVREGGRVRKEYVGGGPVAELVAQMDALERQEREQERRERREERARHAALEAPLTQLCEATDLLAQVALVAADYHRHKGQWRKRRGTVKE